MEVANWDITTAGGTLTVDGTGTISYSTRPYFVDDNHYLVAWAGEGNDGYAQIIEINTTTWACSTVATWIEFDPIQALFCSLGQIDTTHYLCVWGGSGNDGHAQVFTVNTSTWAVSTVATWLEFDTQNGTDSDMQKIDDNHFLVTW